jgi:hypothetical protein
MPAVELTPLTIRGGELLDLLERKTGLLPFRTVEASGAKAYSMAGPGEVDRFEGMLCRIARDWHVHVAFKRLDENVQVAFKPLGE